MENNGSKDTLTYSLKQVLDDVKNQEVWYESNVKMIITFPLIINAGAVVALAAFFANEPSPIFSIKLAVISFILGTTFGIFILILEYLTSYFAMTTFRDHVFPTYDEQSSDNYLDIIIKKHSEYRSNYNKKIIGTIKLRIANGALSIVMCFFGIFFVANYVTKNYFEVIAITTLLAIYFLGTLLWIYCALKPKIEKYK